MPSSGVWVETFGPDDGGSLSTEARLMTQDPRTLNIFLVILERNPLIDQWALFPCLRGMQRALCGGVKPRQEYSHTGSHLSLILYMCRLHGG